MRMPGIGPQFVDPGDALAADPVIDADHPDIRAAASRLGGSGDDDDDRARRLFVWVRDHVGYDMAPDLESPESWRASDTLRRRWGFCQQKAVLLVALARASGIPAVLAFQSVIDHSMPDRFEIYLPEKRMRPHGLAAVWTDGRWQRLDPSLDRGLCERRRQRLVDWTGDGDAVLPRTDLDGRAHFEIEGDLGLFAALTDEMYDATMALSFLHTDEFKLAARRHPAVPPDGRKVLVARKDAT